MDEKIKEKEEKSNVGLMTAAPAVAAEQTPSKKDVEPALLSPEEAKDFRARWDTVQVGFVDDPRQAVEQADSLVRMVMKRLAETFATERERLESQWNRRDDVSTEDFRLALRRYRSFFGRLLSV